MSEDNAYRLLRDAVFDLDLDGIWDAIGEAQGIVWVDAQRSAIERLAEIIGHQFRPQVAARITEELIACCCDPDDWGDDTQGLICNYFIPRQPSPSAENEDVCGCCGHAAGCHDVP